MADLKGKYLGIGSRRASSSPLLGHVGVVILAFLFIFGLAGTIVIWCTQVFDDAVLENLVLKNDSQILEWWKSPPVGTYLRMWVFNYTNTKAFMEGREKLRVEEVGPYTYRRTTDKINVVFNENGTISYRENVSFHFVPHMSCEGGESDRVTVLNLPFLSAISLAQKKSYLERLAVSGSIKLLNTPAFLTMNITEFTWGYRVALVSLAKVFSNFNLDPKNLKLGFLEARENMVHSVTVDSGARDKKRLGMITRVDGQERLGVWGDSYCGSVDASDGFLFPPHLVQSRSRLHLYITELCRRLPFDFKKEKTMKGGVPALEYRPPDNVFGSPEENPDNECFCVEDKCLPAGVYSTSRCNHGAPIVISFPHFYLADPKLRDYVDGLRPQEDKHSMFLDVHPTLGIPLDVVTRVQINAQVHKLAELALDDFFVDDSILPFAWIETEVADVSPEVQSLLFYATFTVQTIKDALKYGLVAVTAVSGVLLLWVARRRLASHKSGAAYKDDRHMMERL